MQFIIIYFSGTGNTKLIAEQIANRLNQSGHEAELVSIEDRDKMQSLDLNGKIVGFGYPVYKFTYPDIFDKVLLNINKQTNQNRYFQFSTYTRFAADALYDFSRQLSNNYSLIAQADFKCPSCGISARRPENSYEYQSVMFFEDGINKKIDEFAGKILDNQDAKNTVEQKLSPFSNLKKNIVKNIEITKYPKLRIDYSKCTVCGLCARKCPDSNLIEQQSSIQIIDDAGCLHCLRCINHCPANAITFGKLTEGENQYTLKTRNTLYEKSANGHKEKYWSNFDKVISKWRRKTIGYWLGHFYRKE